MKKVALINKGYLLIGVQIIKSWHTKSTKSDRMKEIKNSENKVFRDACDISVESYYSTQNDNNYQIMQSFCL